VEARAALLPTSSIVKIPIPAFAAENVVTEREKRLELKSRLVSRGRREVDLRRILAVEARLNATALKPGHGGTGAMRAPTVTLAGGSTSKRPQRLHGLMPRGSAASLKRSRVQLVNKGPSKMELLVAAHKAARMEKELVLEQERGNEAEDSSAGLVLLASDTQATNVTVSGSGVPQKQPPLRVNPGARRAAAALAAKQARRYLRPRDHDYLHGKVISWDVSSIVDDSGKNVVTRIPQPPLGGFQTSEDYVAYWERLLLEEMRAQLGQCLEDEEELSRRPVNGASDANGNTKWACRTPSKFQAACCPVLWWWCIARQLPHCDQKSAGQSRGSLCGQSSC
jgi:hypothetical protein